MKNMSEKSAGNITAFSEPEAFGPTSRRVNALQYGWVGPDIAEAAGDQNTVNDYGYSDVEDASDSSDTTAAVDARFAVYLLAEVRKSLVSWGVRRAREILGKQPWEVEVHDIGGNNGRGARERIVAGFLWQYVIDPGVKRTSREMRGYVVNEAVNEAPSEPGIVAVPTTGEKFLSDRRERRRKSKNVTNDTQPNEPKPRPIIAVMAYMAYHVQDQDALFGAVAEEIGPEGMAVVTTSGEMNKALQHDRLQHLMAKYLTYLYYPNRSADSPVDQSVKEPERFNTTFTRQNAVEKLQKHFKIVDWEIQDTVAIYDSSNRHMLIESIKSMGSAFSETPSDRELVWAAKMAIAEAILGREVDNRGMDAATIQAVNALLMSGTWTLKETIDRVVYVCKIRTEEDDNNNEPAPTSDPDMELVELAKDDRLRRKSGQLALSSV